MEISQCVASLTVSPSFSDLLSDSRHIYQTTNARCEAASLLLFWDLTSFTLVHISVVCYIAANRCSWLGLVFLINKKYYFSGTMAPMGIRLSPLGVAVFCLLGVGVIYHLYAGVISSRLAAFRWDCCHIIIHEITLHYFSPYLHML